MINGNKGSWLTFQHGIPRAAARGDRSEQARQKEAKEIQSYQKLVEDVNEKVSVLYCVKRDRRN